jgi:hypothetical protein
MRMTTLFAMPEGSLTLEPDEIAKITGCSRRDGQIKWLTDNGWTHHKNRVGDPVVGRLYSTLKLSGINPPALTTPGDWTPDFSSIR